MSEPAPTSTASAVLPWVAGALLVVVLLLAFVWLTGPSPDLLPLVYSVL